MGNMGTKARSHGGYRHACASVGLSLTAGDCGEFRVEQGSDGITTEAGVTDSLLR